MAKELLNFVDPVNHDVKGTPPSSQPEIVPINPRPLKKRKNPFVPVIPVKKTPLSIASEYNRDFRYNQNRRYKNALTFDGMETIKAMCTQYPQFMGAYGSVARRGGRLWM